VEDYLMQTLTGDIWTLSTVRDAIVVSTNVGFKADGKNVMGKGLARQATRRWPILASVYGEFCKEHGAATPIMAWPVPNSRWCQTLLLYPVKPLLAEAPYLSWRQPASLPLIEFHLPSLNQYATTFDGRILVPSLGCGNGQLAETDVLPLMERDLTCPNIFHVIYKKE
jgi:hypothetical protein